MAWERGAGRAKFFWLAPIPCCARSGPEGMRVLTSVSEWMRATSPMPLALLLGWSSMAWWLESRPYTPPRQPPECAWEFAPWEEGAEEMVIEDPGLDSGSALRSPLALRTVPGVGRLRARRLAEAAWRQGWQAQQPDLMSRLLALPGIGPVTATHVVAWVSQWAQAAYPSDGGGAYTGWETPPTSHDSEAPSHSAHPP